MGVILTIIKLLWVIVQFCSDGKVFKDYHGPTTIDNDNYWFTTGLTSFEKAAVTNCKYVVIRGFLKEKCLVDGKVYFKVLNRTFTTLYDIITWSLSAYFSRVSYSCIQVY